MTGEKLVRNNIPKIPLKSGEKQRFRKATKEEMPDFLAQKLIEEAKELAAAIAFGDSKAIAEESADLMEVVAGIAVNFGVSSTEINNVRRSKLELKGGFSDGVVLMSPEPPKSPDPCDSSLMEL